MDTINESITNEDLAAMIKKGFDDVTARMATNDELAQFKADMNTRFDDIDKRFESVDYRLHNIELTLDRAVYKDELYTLDQRVSLIERKVGLSA